MERRATMTSLSRTSRASFGKGPNVPRRTKPSFLLSEQQINDIKLAFDLFDTTCCGFVQMRDLRVALRALGFEPGKEELKRMMNEVDHDRSGRISFNDFLHIMRNKMAEKDTREDIIKAFRLFDTEGHGALSLKDLKRVAAELREDLTIDELQEMIDEASTTGNGKVSEKDFLQLLKKITLL